MDLKHKSCLLVLGAKVDDKGNPKTSLVYRLDKAISLYHKYNAKILLSGSPREVNGMRAYLLSKGIVNEDIVLELNSKNTLSNLINSRKMIQTSRTYLITNAFHIPRVRDICSFIGWQDIELIPCQNPKISLAKVIFREVLAMFKWKIKKKFLLDLDGKL